MGSVHGQTQYTRMLTQQCFSRMLTSLDNNTCLLITGPRSVPGSVPAFTFSILARLISSSSLTNLKTNKRFISKKENQKRSTQTMSHKFNAPKYYY